MRLLRARPLIFAVVIMGAFVIMYLDTIGYLTPIEGVIQSGLRPLTATLTEFRLASGELLQTFGDLRDLRQRNAELESLVERLIVENLQLTEVATENEQLRTFFAFAVANPTYDFRGGQIVARVISEGASPFADVLQIDLGEIHDIDVGMAVLTDRGLIGRVVNVQPRTSTILLLSDPNSAINVMTQTSRAPGSLVGRAGQMPLMDLIPPDVEISVGEIVMTSGLGGNFPKGQVVGQIIETMQKDNQMFQQAVVRPTVDFDRLELVLVITSFPPVEAIEADATPEVEIKPEE